MTIQGIQLWCLVVWIGFTAADYELHVTMNTFEIQNQICAICNSDDSPAVSNLCCDGETSSDMQCTIQCDVYFNFCQRVLGTQRNSSECPDGLQRLSTPDFFYNVVSRSFTEGDMFLGLTNPMVFSGTRWVGVQIYFEVKDYDFEEVSEDDLIDANAINVDIPVGGLISRTTYTGRFNNAQVDLSFQVVCAENYYGPDCTRFCNDSSGCPCEPDYTGEFCEVVVGRCEGVDCSGNGRCIEEEDGYTCNCNPGFTGMLCEQTQTEKHVIPKNSATSLSPAIIGSIVGVSVPTTILATVAITLTILLLVVTKKRKNEGKRGPTGVSSANCDIQTIATVNNERLLPIASNSGPGRYVERVSGNGPEVTEEEREFKNPIYGMVDDDDSTGYETVVNDQSGETSEYTVIRVENRTESDPSTRARYDQVYVACPLYAQSIPRDGT